MSGAPQTAEPSTGFDFKALVFGQHIAVGITTDEVARRNDVEDSTPAVSVYRDRGTGRNAPIENPHTIVLEEDCVEGGRRNQGVEVVGPGPRSGVSSLVYGMTSSGLTPASEDTRAPHTAVESSRLLPSVCLQDDRICACVGLPHRLASGSSGCPEPPTPHDVTMPQTPSTMKDTVTITSMTTAMVGPARTTRSRPAPVAWRLRAAEGGRPRETSGTRPRGSWFSVGLQEANPVR